MQPLAEFLTRGGLIVLRLLGAEMVSYAAAELIQLCALAIRTGTLADAVAAQISIHPSHGERLLKAFGADLRDHCEP